MSACAPATSLVLLVDDEPTNIEVMAEVLEPFHDLAFATSGEDALRLATELRPDIILLDIVMPDLDGYAVCARLKEDPATARIPVIFVTALDAAEDEARGLEIGAIDYVSKPVRPAILRARVRTHLELKHAHDALEQVSATDALTGVANRHRLEAVLEREFIRQQRTQAPLSLIMLDVDHFKAFNDSYGHVAGDRCLAQVAQGLNNALRDGVDLVARYGGEEFTCVLPDTSAEAARKVAERLRLGITDLRIPHAKSTSGPFVSVSLGLATAGFGDGSDPHSLLSRADHRLYQAKTAGRNRVCCDADLTKG